MADFRKNSNQIEITRQVSIALDISNFKKLTNEMNNLETQWQSAISATGYFENFQFRLQFQLKSCT